MPIEEARLATLVEVDGVTLDGATLEQILVGAPEQSPGPSQAAAGVAISAFIEGALLRSALAAGDSLTDSATVHAAILADAIRGQVLQHLQGRAAAMPEVTDAQADSLYRIGSVRVLQHILLRINDFQDTSEQRRVGTRIRALVQEMQQDGADFAATARRESEDTVTGPRGGFLPAVRRSELPDLGRFGEIAWSLGPGEVGGPAVSPAGAHVFRRANQVEARPGLKFWLRPVLTRTTDSLWIDSLGSARGLTLAADVVPRLRAMGMEPISAGGGAPLATWEGGELTADEARMWVASLPVLERVAMPAAPDSAITLFAEQLAERDMVAGVAGAVGVSEQAWVLLAPQFHRAVTETMNAYRTQLSAGDPSEAVRSWLVAVSGGGQPYRPLPGLLGAVLRDRADISVNHEAVEAIVRASAREWNLRHGKVDSAGTVIDTSAGAIGADSTTP